MPERTRLFGSTVVLCLMLAGAALKAERYGSHHTPDFTSFERNLIKAFDRAGWHQSAGRGNRTDLGYHALTFRHPSCPRPVMLANFGHTPSLDALLELRATDGIERLQDGAAIAVYDVRALQLARLTAAVRRWLGLGQAEVAPLLALSPTRAHLAAACPASPLPSPAALYREEPWPGRVADSIIR